MTSPILSRARVAFSMDSDHASAGALLEASQEAHDNEDISDRDYDDDVASVTRWLIRTGREERIARNLVEVLPPIREAREHLDILGKTLRTMRETFAFGETVK